MKRFDPYMAVNRFAAFGKSWSSNFGLFQKNIAPSTFFTELILKLCREVVQLTVFQDLVKPRLIHLRQHSRRGTFPISFHYGVQAVSPSRPNLGFVMESHFLFP